MDRIGWIGWLIDWLIDDRLIDWLIDWLIQKNAPMATNKLCRLLPIYLFILCACVRACLSGLWGCYIYVAVGFRFRLIFWERKGAHSSFLIWFDVSILIGRKLLPMIGWKPCLGQGVFAQASDSDLLPRHSLWERGLPGRIRRLLLDPDRFGGAGDDCATTVGSPKVALLKEALAPRNSCS